MLRQFIPDKSRRRRESTTTDLRAELHKALQTGRLRDALSVCELIEKRKPDEPRWARRKAELLHRMGRHADAVAAYQRAIDLYTAKGFEARAVATAKVMLSIQPSKEEAREPIRRPPRPRPRA